MPTPNCAPSYIYRPAAFIASSEQCSAPVYAEHRSRLTAGNAFFRSKLQGVSENDIAIECVTTPSNVCNVYVGGILVRAYPVTFTAGGIDALRVAFNSDPYPQEVPIEMPSLNYDVYDAREYEDTEEDINLNVPYTGLEPFTLSSLSGGSGGPTTPNGLATIRTGPERSVFIVSTTENANGVDVTPTSQRIRQWDGSSWISYCNNIQGDCPGEGTC